MARVLVAYATKYGSTREVAERVASVLNEQEIEAEARAARDVERLGGYSAVVLGGALYYFMWHKDARHFVTHHRKELTGLPVALFGMGPFENTAEQLEEARKPIDKLLAKQEWLHPVSTRIFGGKFDPTGLRFPEANPAMKKMEPSDARDWDAIDAWARELSAAFAKLV